MALVPEKETNEPESKQIQKGKDPQGYKTSFFALRDSVIVSVVGLVLLGLPFVIHSPLWIGPLLQNLGSVVLPIGLLSIFFELSWGRSLMEEIESKLRELVNQVLEKRIIGRLDSLDSQVKGLSDVELKLSDEIESKLRRVVEKALQSHVIGKLDGLESEVKRVEEFELKLREAIREEHTKMGSLGHLIKSGIVNYAESGQAPKIKNLLINAKKTIRVCKTWIPELEALKAGLKDALGDGSDKEVRILCLDPDSPLAVQRSRDLKFPESYSGNQIRTRLWELFDFCRNERFLDRVSIKTYTNLPSVSTYGADDRLLVGWYWNHQLSFEGPVLEVHGATSDLSQNVEKNFDAMWETASDYTPEIERRCIWSCAQLDIPDEVRQELRPHISHLNDASRIAQLKQNMIKCWPALANLGAEILKRTTELGYVLVRGFPFHRLDSEEAKVMFHMLTVCCGTPVSHVLDGDRFVWDVTPLKGVEKSPTTYSENNQFTPLHTDSHYRNEPEQFIAVLVEHPANCGGGRTVLLRIEPLLAELKATVDGRKCLEILRSTDFPSLVPATYRAGEPSKIKQARILRDDTVRFRPDTIDAAIKKASNVTQDEEWAVSYFKKLVNRSPDRLGVYLRKGDMLFIDNHTVLHGRTAFQDNERLLLRIRFNSPTSL